MGRDRELEELLVGLDEAAAGRGGLFLLAGDGGVGKSRLAEELGGRARARGVEVLRGQCWEAGGAPAYWPWIQLLRSHVRDRGAAAAIPELAQLLPELDGAGGHAPESLDPETARFRLFDATARFLQDAARARPLMLVLDDLHVADMTSLLLLQFLASTLAESRILVIGTYRQEGVGRDHPLALALADLGRRQVTRRIVLGGLAEPDVGRYLELTAGGAAPTRLVRAVHEATEGNPLFVGEIARLIADEGAPQDTDDPFWRLTVPQGVREVIGRRLASLSPDCDRLLTLAAVLGREFGLDALEQVTGRSGEDLLITLQPAFAAQVIAEAPSGSPRLRFAHVLVRDTLYDDLPLTQRTLLHRDIGEALEVLYAQDPEPYLAELAHHFLQAASAGTVAKAVAYGQRAAERALELLAYEEAARLVRMALRARELTGRRDERTRCELLLTLGEALARAGDVHAARETFLNAAAIARDRPDALARAALGYGGRFVWDAGRGDRHLVPLLEDALRALRDAGDSALLARVTARLAGGPLREDPVRERGARLSLEAVEMARRLDDPATLAYVLDARYAAVWWPDNLKERIAIATELVHAADAAGDKERALQGYHYRCLARLEAADLPGALADLDVKAQLCEELGQPAHRWYVDAVRATLATFAGRFDEAEELIPSAFMLGERAVGSTAACYRAIQLYLLRRHQGRLANAERTIRRAADGFPTYGVLQCILAHVHCELGRDAAAREAFEALAADDFAGLPRNDEWLFATCLLAEVAAHLGDVARATTLYDRLRPFAARNAVSNPDGCTGAVARNLGLLAGTLSRWDAAERHFAEALDANAQAGARPWTAYVLRDHAAVLVRRDEPGDREAARALLARATEKFQALGMGAAAAGVAAGLQVPVAVADATGRTASPASPMASVFRREGELWSIAFAGDAFHLRDSKGMGYIAALLASPGRDVPAWELATDGAAGRPDRDAGAAIDIAARDAYRVRAADLREELEEAEAWRDGERAAAAREELDFLTRELAATVGLGGRPRGTGSPAERARQSTTKAVRLALRRIEQHSPALGRHLASTLRTGTYCRYDPDPRVAAEWEL